MDRVTIRPAYAWDCPECGREYFERVVALDHETDTVQEMIEGRDVDLDRMLFVRRPQTVSCKTCQMTFDVIPLSEGSRIDEWD